RPILSAAYELAHHRRGAYRLFGYVRQRAFDGFLRRRGFEQDPDALADKFIWTIAVEPACRRVDAFDHPIGRMDEQCIQCVLKDRFLSDAEVAIALAGATLVVDEPVDAQTRRQNGQKKDQLGRQGEITGAEAGSLRS